MICQPCTTAPAGAPHDCEDRKPGLWYSGCPCQCYTVPRHTPTLVVTTEMRDALIRLGWTPPPGETK